MYAKAWFVADRTQASGWTRGVTRLFREARRRYPAETAAGAGPAAARLR